MEDENGVEEKLGSPEVVVSIGGIDEDNKNTEIRSQQKEVHRLKSYMQVPTGTISDSTQMPKSSSTVTTNISSNAPVGTVTEGSSLPPHLISSRMASHSGKTNSSTKKANVKTTSMIEKVPSNTSREDKDDGEDEENEIDDGGAYATENYKAIKKKDNKWEVMYILELAICTCIIAGFITSLSVPKLRHVTFWGLEIWRWCVLLLVIFCGRLMTEVLTNVIVFLIERNFVLRKKVLYFVHSLKRSVQVFFWLALVLLTWVVLIRKKLKEPKNTTVVLRHITRFLVSSLFGAGLWVMKTLLVKILACSFHVKRFFDRIQDSIFHQYVLLVLSEPSWKKNQRSVAKIKLLLILRKLMKGNIVEEQIIDVEKLSKMIKDTVSAWTISGLVNVIQGSGLATISSVLDGNVDITNEEDAKRAGDRIFTNVATATRRNSQYIDEEDLLLFLKKDDVDKVFNMFNCSAESRKIKRIAMRDWVVKVYKERELLAQSIKDAKTAIEEMNRILSGIALIIIIVVWLVLMGLATTQMLVFISSQLLVLTFIFGNSCKTGFECIIYVFVMHPYDVGDRCVINGVQMIVEEMNILTTIFKSGKETIVYPNSVLAATPISNFYRSQDTSENVEFVIDVSTSAETIAKMKSKIIEYIENKHEHWHPTQQFKEIKDGNKLKMVLYVNPAAVFLDYGENSNRRPELLNKIKEIFEELEIKYYYLPQEVHLSNVGSHGQ